MGGFSSTPRAAICLVVRQYGSLSYEPRAAICLVVKRLRGFSYSSRVGTCLVVRLVGNLSYTPLSSKSYLPFVGVSATHCVMQSVGSVEGWDVSLKRPALESVSSFGE